MENVSDMSNLVIKEAVTTAATVLCYDYDKVEVRSPMAVAVREHDLNVEINPVIEPIDDKMLEEPTSTNDDENMSIINETGINTDGKNLSEINLRLAECDLLSNNEENSVDDNLQTTESIEIIAASCESFPDIKIDASQTANKNRAQTVEDYKINFCYDWNEAPILLCSAVEEYEPTAFCENFTKGCQWSPDGTCLLVPSEDFRIRVYELPRELYSGILSSEIILPPLKAAVTVKEGGIIYDSCWFPMMNSWDPSTCCFASTSRESPVHLWDAFNGELRATYRAYNQVDEVEAAISVQFINSGAEVWCGFKGALRTFHTDRPGRQVDTIYLKKDIPNVTGIVSCIRENPTMPGLVAFGTYSKTIGLYKDGPLCALKTASGVTQIEFSPCGMKLYSAVRRNNEMLCWDLRNPGTVLYSVEGRKADTNQRIQFSISPDGNEIVSGGTDGVVPVWQQDWNIVCEENLESKQKIKLSADCINGVNLHRSLPIMATSSGQRICDEENQVRDNSVRFWWCGSRQRDKYEAE